MFLIKAIFYLLALIYDDAADIEQANEVMDKIVSRGTKLKTVESDFFEM